MKVGIAYYPDANGDLRPIAALVGPRGKDGTDGEQGLPGNDGKEIDLSVTATHIVWRYTGEEIWNNLIALSELQGDTGATGADGREIELNKGDTHLQWRYVGGGSWTNIVALSEITGQQGEQGIQGIQGIQGERGEDGGDFTVLGYYDTLNALETAVPNPNAGDAYGVGNEAPYDIYIWDGVNDEWKNNGTIQGAKGDNGADGKSVELQTTASYIQWRNIGDSTWQNVIALSALKGSDGNDGVDGKSVELQVTETHIQWKQSDGAWQNLILLSSLKGKDGADGIDGISEITTATDTTISGLLKGASGKVALAVKSDITALGIPAQDTTYADATTSVAGLMSANDKTKLNGIATGADVSVNADWNASSGKAQILNKPTLPTVPTKTSDLTNDSGFIATETDPTVPSWAKAASKPSYSASEVGAVPTTRTVNGKALSSNITLTANDVSAVPTTQKGAANGVASLNSSGKVTPEQTTSPIFTLTANTQLALAHANTLVLVNAPGGTGYYIYVPSNASVAFPTGTEIEIVRWGAGSTIIEPSSGVTIRSSGSKRYIANQYETVALKKIGTNEWLLVGALSDR